MLLTNYYPNPRFAAGRQLPSLNGCTAVYYGRYDPDNGQHPGVTLTATRDGDNWAQIDLTLTANLKIVLAVGSGYMASQPQAGAAAQLWGVTGNRFLASVPTGWNKTSAETTVPSDGKLRVMFRAPKTSGDAGSIMNVFLGTLADYTRCKALLPTPWFDGNLMPLNGGGWRNRHHSSAVRSYWGLAA